MKCHVQCAKLLKAGGSVVYSKLSIAFQKADTF